MTIEIYLPKKLRQNHKLNAVTQFGIERGIADAWKLGGKIDKAKVCVFVKRLDGPLHKNIMVDGWVRDHNTVIVLIAPRYISRPFYADEIARITTHELDHLDLLRSGHAYKTAGDFIFSEGRAQIAETAFGRKILPRSLFHDTKKAEAFLAHALRNFSEKMRGVERGQINSYSDWFTHDPTNPAFPRHGGYALAHQILSAYLKAKKLFTADIRKIKPEAVFSALEAGELTIGNTHNTPLRRTVSICSMKPMPTIIVK